MNENNHNFSLKPLNEFNSFHVESPDATETIENEPQYHRAIPLCNLSFGGRVDVLYIILTKY